MRLKLLSCEIFYREFSAALARSPHTVDVEFLPKGLHDVGVEKMRAQLQAALDRVDTSRYDAVLLGYGLCNNGIVGLAARDIPLVVPRAHDCITLFLGSAERYLAYFDSHPGVFFKTTGWIERGGDDGELSQLAIGKAIGMDWSYEALVAKYGEDNARYLQEQFDTLTKNYSQFTFVEMGVEPNGSFEQRTREEAARRGWKFEKLAGDLGMIERLLSGNWDAKEFLVVPPGQRIVARYDEGIISTEEAAP
jgi:hypothetical protein